MSHPSAGDISLPREGRGRRGGAPRRGLILPQSGPYPPTIIPLTHAKSRRDSGDYVDVPSLNSRLSSLSVETSRSEQYLQLPPPPPARVKSSSDHSSDYEDQELPSPIGRTYEKSCSSGRTRGHRTQDGKRTKSNNGTVPSTSSAESIPSGSGSSTQALVREASGSLSAGDGYDGEVPIGPAPQGGNIPAGPVIGKARALVDCVPNPYDKEALKFKKGDVIDITQMNQSGLWQGVVNGRTGLFKFINVELLSENATKRLRLKQNKIVKKGKPKTVEELLKRINMEEHTSVFVLNGYEDVELFQDLEGHDLDFLGIRDPEHRAKLLTAVQLLHDYDSDDYDSRSSSDSSSPVSATSSTQSAKHLAQKQSSTRGQRDSGCYDSNSVDEHQNKKKYHKTTAHDVSNNLDLKQNPRRLFQSLHSKNTSTKATDQAGEAVEMNVLNNHQVSYHPNIPVCEITKKNTAKEFLEQTREVLDRAREITNTSREIREQNEDSDKRSEDSCENKTVKYAGGVTYDMGPASEVSNAVFSEKSSDSGVSSSSLSSNNLRDRVKVHLDSPNKKLSRVYSPTTENRPKLDNQTNPFLVHEMVSLTQNGGNFKTNDDVSKKNNRSSPTRTYPAHLQNRSSPGLIVHKKN